MAPQLREKKTPNDIDIAVLLTDGNPFEVAFRFKQILEENGFPPEELDVKGF